MPGRAVILLVEDDLALLEGIGDLLEVTEIGYDIQVLKAVDGQDGLQKIDEQTPDLIISDIMMPGMDGFTFLSKIREKPAWVHIPFIFLTAKGTERDILRGRFSGAELYITKPYDSDELLQLVGSQLDRAFELQQDRRQRLDVLGKNIVQLLNHEFRTPLTYVTAYSDMLSDGFLAEDTENLREYLRGIKAGANRLNRLVFDLIQVMELRTGETAARFRQTARIIYDLETLLYALCRSPGMTAAGKTLLIECHIASPLPAVYGDPESLIDVFRRLIANAVKFSILKGTGEVRVSLAAVARNRKVQVSISDHGIGIPPGVQQRIFELFYQHNREQFEQQGAGTGLTVAKELVDLHGGRIEVESREGFGSKFTVVLPVFETVTEQNGRRPALNIIKKQATILIVEDEWLLLQGLRDLLQVFESHYELTVNTASDGLEGLAMLERQTPDLILSDIMMPRMDGYRFLAEVRKRPEWLHIPLVFLTAKGERQDELLGRRLGAEEYITKPYDTAELFTLVISQLDRYFQHQSLFFQDLEELKRGVLNQILMEFDMPLGIVSDYAEKLALSLEQVASDEDLARSLYNIHQSSGQVEHLVEDFMLLVELQTGEADAWFDFHAQLVTAKGILDYIGGTASRSFEIVPYHEDPDGPAGNLASLVDLTKLATCLDRLAEGLARRGTKDDKLLLTLSIVQRSEQFILRFASNAVGFGHYQLSQINALLASEQAFVAQLSEYEPGLLVAKGIVSLHGGQIAVEQRESNEVDFVISLPVYRPESIESFNV